MHSCDIFRECAKSFFVSFQFEFSQSDVRTVRPKIERCQTTTKLFLIGHYNFKKKKVENSWLLFSIRTLEWLWWVSCLVIVWIVIDIYTRRTFFDTNHFKCYKHIALSPSLYSKSMSCNLRTALNSFLMSALAKQYELSVWIQVSSLILSHSKWKSSSTESQSLFTSVRE